MKSLDDIRELGRRARIAAGLPDDTMATGNRIAAAEFSRCDDSAGSFTELMALHQADVAEQRDANWRFR
jgi:hypothetical protein